MSEPTVAMRSVLESIDIFLKIYEERMREARGL